MVRCWAFFILLFSLQSEAHGADAWDHCLALDQQSTWDFTESGLANFFLTNTSDSGTFLTPAAAHLSWNTEGNLSTLFDFKTPKMSNPYNVLKWELTVGADNENDQFYSVQVFANDCGGNGGEAPSMSPGKKIRLEDLAIPAHSNGEPRRIEPIHIKIWGHIH